MENYNNLNTMDNSQLTNRNRAQNTPNLPLQPANGERNLASDQTSGSIPGLSNQMDRTNTPSPAAGDDNYGNREYNELYKEVLKKLNGKLAYHQDLRHQFPDLVRSTLANLTINDLNNEVLSATTSFFSKPKEVVISYIAQDYVQGLSQKASHQKGEQTEDKSNLQSLLDSLQEDNKIDEGLKKNLIEQLHDSLIKQEENNLLFGTELKASYERLLKKEFIYNSTEWLELTFNPPAKGDDYGNREHDVSYRVVLKRLSMKPKYHQNLEHQFPSLVQNTLANRNIKDLNKDVLLVSESFFKKKEVISYIAQDYVQGLLGLKEDKNNKLGIDLQYIMENMEGDQTLMNEIKAQIIKNKHELFPKITFNETDDNETFDNLYNKVIEKS